MSTRITFDFDVEDEDAPNVLGELLDFMTTTEMTITGARLERDCQKIPFPETNEPDDLEIARND